MSRSPDRWLVGWALGYAAVGAASLVVPLYAIELGAGALLVGLMAATAAFAGVPGAILWGRLASSTGRRRPFVLVALGSTAGVLALVPALTSPWHVLVANAGLWFVVSAAAPVLNLIVVEGVPSAEWELRFARLNVFQGYGWLGGLLAGAIWTALTRPIFGALGAQRSFFLVAAASALVGLGLVRLWYPQRPHITEVRFERLYESLSRRRGWGAGRYVRAVPFGPNRLYWALRTVHPREAFGKFPSGLRAYLLAATLFFLGFSVFFGPLPAYLTGAGYGTTTVFSLFVVSSVGSAVTYELAGRFAAAGDPRTLQSGALAVRAFAFPLVVLAGLLLPVRTGVVAVGALFFVIGVTWAFIAVTATGLVTRLTPEPLRGEALGLYTALGGLGGAVGSALGGAIADAAGYLLAFGLAGVIVLAALALVVASDPSTTVRADQRRSERPPPIG